MLRFEIVNISKSTHDPITKLDGGLQLYPKAKDNCQLLSLNETNLFSNYSNITSYTRLPWVRVVLGTGKCLLNVPREKFETVTRGTAL